jgi:hypothetical protein
MKRCVTLASLSILLIAGARASASGGFNPGGVAASAGSYSCGFDSTGYEAPGTDTDVAVGGVFTLTIGRSGTISQGDFTMSVDDGGAGPAICKYQSGAGQITTVPYIGDLGVA